MPFIVLLLTISRNARSVKGRADVEREAIGVPSNGALLVRPNAESTNAYRMSLTLLVTRFPFWDIQRSHEFHNGIAREGNPYAKARPKL